MSEAGSESKAAREAAEWLARLNSRSVSTDELNDFYEWRRIPENAEAYARGEQLWHDARALGDDRDIAQAVREALERPRLEYEQGMHRIGRRALLAGGGALLAAGGAGWFLLTRPAAYRTAVGEQLAVRLDDGTLMRLNTDSEALVSYSSARRRVEMARGQAFFEVQPDPARPFEVRFGDFEAVALGTKFEVADVDGRASRVVLVNGRVRVEQAGDGWEQLLAAPGDALFLSGRGRPTIRRVDAEALTSWTVGRLTFRRTPLRAAIAEVNRYSHKQIILRAPDLQSMEVDGVFETGDPETFVSAVTALFPLRVRKVSEERIVLTRT